MNSPEIFFHELYTVFNNRDIKPVLARMTPDVQWAKGQFGGLEEAEA